MKKMICKILSAIMILTSVTAISVSADEAVPTTSTVLVNGNNIKFDSYNINGNNYFKLRDLAYVLNATEKQFSIGYNEVLNTVSLTSRQPYIAVGGEMEIGDGDNVQTEPTSSTILKNGEVVQLQAYLIDDSNYFKLRDIGELLDFSVEWNGEENSISIDTSKSYVSENEGDKVTEDTYYSQYKTGEFVEITGKLVSIEKIKEVISTSDNDVWLGCLKNAENTEWMVCLNVEEYGIGHKSDFEGCLYSDVKISGIYEGYSKTYEKPVITLYAMTCSNGNSVNGIRKVEEMLNNGQIPIESEFDPYVGGMSIEYMSKEMQYHLRGIKRNLQLV
jgi:hypothetical protein